MRFQRSRLTERVPFFRFWKFGKHVNNFEARVFIFCKVQSMILFICIRALYESFVRLSEFKVPQIELNYMVELRDQLLKFVYE